MQPTTCHPAATQIQGLEAALARYGYRDLFAPLPPESPLDMLEMAGPGPGHAQQSQKGMLSSRSMLGGGKRAVLATAGAGPAACPAAAARGGAGCCSAVLPCSVALLACGTR